MINPSTNETVEKQHVNRGHCRCPQAPCTLGPGGSSPHPRQSPAGLTPPFSVDVPRIPHLAVAKGLEGSCNPDTASYFLSRMTMVPTNAPGMSRWRKRLFMGIARNASNPVTYFGLPVDRTVVMGSHIEF